MEKKVHIITVDSNMESLLIEQHLKLHTSQAPLTYPFTQVKGNDGLDLSFAFPTQVIEDELSNSTPLESTLLEDEISHSTPIKPTSIEENEIINSTPLESTLLDDIFNSTPIEPTLEMETPNLTSIESIEVELVNSNETDLSFEKPPLTTRDIKSNLYNHSDIVDFVVNNQGLTLNDLLLHYDKKEVIKAEKIGKIVKVRGLYYA